MIAPQHRDVDRAEQLGIGLEAHGAPGHGQQVVGDSYTAASRPLHVVDLARLAVLDQQAVGPHHVAHVGEVTSGRGCRW